MNNESYCKEYVRKHDSWRYTSASMVHKNNTRAIFAMFALHITLCDITSVNSLQSMMKLQWWIDTFVKRNTCENVPIAKEVLLISNKIPESILVEYMENLYNGITESYNQNIVSIEKYATKTIGLHIKSTLYVIGINNNLNEIVYHAACAIMLGNIIRNTYHKPQKCKLPYDMLYDVGIKLEDIYSDANKEGLHEIIRIIALRCESHVDIVLNSLKSMDIHSRSMFIYILILKRYIHRILKRNVFSCDPEEISIITKACITISRLW